MVYLKIFLPLLIKCLEIERSQFCVAVSIASFFTFCNKLLIYKKFLKSRRKCNSLIGIYSYSEHDVSRRTMNQSLEFDPNRYINR